MAKQSTTERWTIDAPDGLSLDRLEHMELYYFMMLNRRLEDRLSVMYRQNKVIGGLYSSLGQEACSVGSAWALEEGDFLAPMIRNLGSLLVRGVRPIDVMAQYCARAIGPTRGKDLNLHFGDIERGLIAPISVVGALIPVMAGVAFEMKVHGKPNVALTYIGDGGMSTADFHEGINFASVRRLPLIIIVENNQFAYSTPTSMQCNVKQLAVRAAGYGIPGETVEGNNVLAMVEAVRRARRTCIDGGGPVLIEAVTFRRKGHAEHDDAGYVPQEIRDEWEAKDPLDAYRRYLADHRIATPEELDETEKEIVGMLERSAEEVLAAPFPDASIAMEDVYG